MKVSELVGQGVYCLMPPAWRFYPVLIMLLLASVWSIAASLCAGYPRMGLLPWIGVIFGGIVLLLLLPRNWQRWRLAELAWSAEHLYLLNGSDDQALALPRSALVGIIRQRKIGHHGQWLAFSLDLRLDNETLARATRLMGVSLDETHVVSAGVYRFGFKGAWHTGRALRGILLELLPL